MIWLTWRQLRGQAVVVYAAVAVAVVVLLRTRPGLSAPGFTTSIFDGLTRTDRGLFFTGVIGLALAPALVGAFWGAPMVARELEAGTHRLVWNQSVTRTRWLAAKLTLTVLVTAVGIGALTLAVTWWSAPIDGATSNTHGGLPARLTPVTFAMRGVAPIAYAVFALVLRVAVGCVLRRTLAAMALTLALFTVIQVAVPLWIRPHLVPPTTAIRTITWGAVDGIRDNGAGPVSLTLTSGDRNDWILSNDTVNADGKVVALPLWLDQCLPKPPSGPSAAPVEVDEASLEACFDRLGERGYRQRLVYQRADSFWPLQWAETALFLALSGLLAAVCVWWTRHRLS